jgi:glycolate oxidase FAD binding subunit
MKSSSDRLAERLESELGADAVTGEPALLAAHRIDGKEPRLVCFPADSGEVAVVLRLCSEVDAGLAPWGGGTAIGIGNPPRRLDVVMGLHRLNRLVEHDQANLTATAQSGITLAGLQEKLARENQFLTFDPPAAARATVGGIVATNLNGPRRSYYGSVRDQVIGMRAVLASGEAIKAGGKVVKNVAGYDMCKLFVGSLGTLGIITEVTLRMAPIPETAQTLVASGILPDIGRFANNLSGSQLFPAAIFLSNTNASKTANSKGEWCIAVWCEGFENSVARQLHESQAMAERSGLALEAIRGPDHTRLWQTIRDFPLQEDRLVYRVIVPSGSAIDFIQTVLSGSNTDTCAEIVGDAAMGVLWISMDANDRAAQWFVKLMAEAHNHRGHAVMLAAPPNLKRSIDVWGSSPPALSLMREIKRQFDPNDLLNPGRMVGGI